MRNKILTRIACAFLTVLMVVAVVPAMTLTVFAAEAGEEEVVLKPYQQNFTAIAYASAEERLAAMTKYYENADYALYVEKADDPTTAAVESTGVVAYVKKSTGEILFTNPWNTENIKHASEDVMAEQMSQIILTYSGGEDGGDTLNSYTNAVQKGQVTIKTIKNGVRVEYVIGDRSARILVPKMIEREAFETKILEPIEASIPGGKNSREYMTFKSYFREMFYTDDSLSETKKESIAMKYPVTKEKNIDVYVCDVNASVSELRELEELIMAYCPAYNFEELDNDHMYVNYEDEVMSPAVFKTAIEYTLDGNGMRASMSANGLRFDESTYRLSHFKVLPYMGASLRTNEGYTFLPDGSGAIYKLDTKAQMRSRVYGDDYALSSNDMLYSNHTETVRMPVFGQVETDAESGVSRGYLGIIEEGESFAFLNIDHDEMRKYSTVTPEFSIRQKDVSQTSMSQTGYSVYAERRYVDSFAIRYVMLSDDALAQKAGLTSYYECSWMGMACAYRDYLDATKEGFDRLSAEDVEASIPLYIETFGSVKTTKKVLSMPVTVSVALTSFDDVATMYEFLAGNGIENVNFKLTGYANGGMYSDVPYQLKWEKAVGGKGGFKDLVALAKENGFGLFPDFDFVYSTSGDMGNKVNMKKHASRAIDNRYTSRREYSATHQTLVSHFQMVMSPVTYSRFYEKLENKYGKYGNTGISLSTFGSALNSDYDVEKTSLREESKGHVITALSYFKNKEYDVMVEGGNAFTWGYVDHILGVPLDSSRYNVEYSSVPFMGVVLHGYVEFAGSPLNMEGGLTYAMLKAMENGAGAYFVLSYANTALLKEDEVLSQNYSVRYDIWQDRLVEIYKELNSVLFDLQDKIITDHEILNDASSRVPEESELIRDVIAEAEEKQQAIKDQIAADHANKLATLRDAANLLDGADDTLTAIKDRVVDATNGMKNQFTAGGTSNLVKAWVARRGAAANLSEKEKEALITTLRGWLDTYVITNVVSFEIASATASYTDDAAAAKLVAAKEAYDILKADYDAAAAAFAADASKANEETLAAKTQILTKAYSDMVAAVKAYAVVMDAADSRNVSVTDEAIAAYVNGNTTAVSALTLTVTGEQVKVSDADLEAFIFGDAAKDAKYADIDVVALYDAVIRQLKTDGLYDEMGVEEMLKNAKERLTASEEQTPEEAPEETPGETPEQGGETEGEEQGEAVVPDPPKDKYAVDNNVVAVTYGYNMDQSYKTLLLNFNDYAIKTTYNGVNYTIEAYGYVVIKR